VLEGIDALAHAGLGIAFDVVEHVESPDGVQAGKYSSNSQALIPEG
jgi:hypothetical protein